MQLPTVSRSQRVRRVLAVTAAAAAVMVGPTACDYTAYAGGSSPQGVHDPAHKPGAGHGTNDQQQPVVVPVGNTTANEPAADASATATTSQRADRQNRRWRTYNNAGATSTTAAPAPDQGGANGGTGGAVGAGAGAAAGAGAGAAAGDPAATDSAAATASAASTDSAVPPTTAPPVAAGAGSVAAGGADGKNNGLDVLGRDCTNSKLAPHDGFQKSPACVSTQMGEVAAEDKLPSLMIADFPTSVGKNVKFTLKISTRNLVRDRFLGAKAGGYYLESSFLDANGLQRGHFHTACRILPGFNEAPDSSKAPEFFLATEDGGGGTAPDTVTIEVPGIPTAGSLQCTSWAGDGSHRTPMMTKANETPAIDSVRIKVTDDAAAPTGYTLAAGNDPAAAQADLAQQADAKQAEAGVQKPDVEKNGNTDTGNGVPAATGVEGTQAPAAPAADSAAPAADPAPATESAAPSADSSADESAEASTKSKAPAGDN